MNQNNKINLKSIKRKGLYMKMDINLENELANENSQKNFLETMLGKAINTALDIGIRAILPTFVEDQVINIKDNLFNYGLKEGIAKTIEDTIELGKSAIGIVTGNFENVTQMQIAVENGGLIDGFSSLLDVVVNKANKEGLLNNTVATTIRQGKNAILSNLETNIKNSFNRKYKVMELTDNYIDNWKKYYEERNFDGMEREYIKIGKQLKDIVPIENTINNIKTIEVIHNLIKNNGQNFNLSAEELDLAEKLK